MLLVSMLNGFHNQCKINPVPDCDLEAAMAYYIKHGYNLSESYHSNPELTYKPNLSSAVADIIFRTRQKKGERNQIRFRRGVGQWMDLYTQCIPPAGRCVSTLDIPFPELIRLCGTSCVLIPEILILYKADIFTFGDTEQSYADHLSTELVRCDGNLANLTYVAGIDMDYDELTINLTFYRILVKHLPDFNPVYWKIDNSFTDNMVSCGFTPRRLLKFLFTTILCIAYKVRGIIKTPEEIEQVLNWKQLVNLIDHDQVPAFINRTITHWYAWVFRKDDITDPLNSRALWTAFTHLTRNPKAKNLPYPSFPTDPLNPLDYLWLMNHPRWLENSEVIPGEDVYLHHHYVCAKIFEHYPVIDYSKHPSEYTALLKDRMVEEHYQKKANATKYPTYPFTQYLNPEEFVHIADSYHLVLEGEKMNHCVGGYDAKVMQGSSIILHYYNPEQEDATIELSRTESVDHELTEVKHYDIVNERGEVTQYTIWQIHTHSNGKVTKEVERYIADTLTIATRKAFEIYMSNIVTIATTKTLEELKP